MAGQIKKALDEILYQRSKGNVTLMTTTKTKLLLKGINLDQYSDASPDDAAVLEKIHQIAAEFGVTLSF